MIPEGFEKVMNAPEKGWPTLDDFRHRRVFIDSGVVKRVDDSIRKHRRCLIRGAEGRGKTVLARVVGFLKHKEGWEIRFIDVREATREDIDQICRYIGDIRKRKTLFIVENLRPSLDEMAPRLKESADENGKASFVFTARKTFPGEEQLLVGDPFEEWEERGWYVDLIPGPRVVRGIIETFIAANVTTQAVSVRQDMGWFPTL